MADRRAPRAERARIAAIRQGSARLLRLGLLAAVALLLASCGSTGPEGVYKVGRPYQIAGRWYYPEFDPSYDQVGIASWYGREFHGRSTANGETFDRSELTAAHPTLPLPSIVRVTNLANHRQMELRVNDRGPFVGDRVIDLSQAAARALGFERQGITRVRVQFVGLADAKGEPPRPSPQHARNGTRAPPASPTVVAAAPAAQCGGHFIQVGAFAEPERAVYAATRLQGVGVVPVSTERPHGDRLIRVRVGPIADPGTVEATLYQLKQSGYAGAFIVGSERAGAAEC